MGAAFWLPSFILRRVISARDLPPHACDRAWAHDGDGKTLIEKMDEITKAFCASRLAPEESAK
jgi:hypothetical protein